ncbi:MAG: VOC family protein [Rhodospirillaceae bacterium]|jgi:catechol 2,3-dioxygenase-like lactoylglutathione lyase family enzyme|nr:VOC family protein [Rhodospirillaceae bacterium]
MKRGIDHLVLAVRNLDAAAAFYEGLGFTLTPKAQHPFGTGNRLVQLQGGFLELVAITEPDWVADAGPGEFSFGAYNRDYLAAQEGFSMIALQSDDWQGDRAVFQARQLVLPAPFSFSRMATQPDGSEVEMGFDLTFVPRTEAPDAMFFTCQHRHAPEHFYKPAYQQHANGAVRIASVTIESPDVEATTAFLQTLGVDQSLFQIVEGPSERFAGFEIAMAAGNTALPQTAFGVQIDFTEETN